MGKQYLDLNDKTAIKNDKIQYAYLSKILNVTSPYSPKKGNILANWILKNPLNIFLGGKGRAYSHKGW